MTTERFLGLISGTSADGVDAAMVEFDGASASIVHADTTPYPDDLRFRIESVIAGDPVRPEILARLDAEIGAFFGGVARAAIAACDGSIRAIGSHGQTVAHHPGGEHAATLQLGDPNRIAVATGLPVVADFRRADIAVGGQGAPLAPLFHALMGTEPVLNLGGIANLTVFDGESVVGFDVGPANTLLDAWAMKQGLGRYDEGGAFAGRGSVDQRLLDAMLTDPYFSRPPPKSCGREMFNLGWLTSRLGDGQHAPEDIQATLAELTAATVSAAVHAHAGSPRRLLICGGGVHNTDLMARLAARLTPTEVATTTVVGMDPDHVEAVLFAWLARERMSARSPSNLGQVTGATAPAVLGAIWLPPR